MNELITYNPNEEPRGLLFYYPKTMQKLINALALTSFAVSGVAVAGGTYIYLNKDAILSDVQAQVIAEVTGGIPLPGVGGGLPDIGGGLPGIGDKIAMPSTGPDRTLEGMDSATGAGPFPAVPPVLGPMDSNPFNKISETSQETTEERQARRERVGLGGNVTISTVDGNRHLR